MKKQNHLFISAIMIALFFNACKKDDDNIAPAKCTISESDQIVIDDLNSTYAHPFSPVNPAAVDDKLTPLIDYLGEANFVGMGEATHGTSEFYKMKDQLFRALVKEKGFKAIIFELPWGNALKVNDFVTKDIGTAKNVVGQTIYWTYDTQEVIDLVQWIHDYNMGRADDEKIYFVGNDPQGSDFEIERNLISGYLEQVQPDSVNSVMQNYSSLPFDLNDYSNENQSIKNANIEGTQKVYDYFVEHKDLFVAASSELEYEIALMASHVVQSREYIFRIGDFGTPRDSRMAEYSEWWQRILGENAKVAIWAHNFHVMDGSSINLDAMGTFLHNRHFSTYRNVGFSFGKGDFNAFVAGPDFEFVGGVRKQTVPNDICGTIGQLLSEVDGGQNYIIFSELSGPTIQYFDKEHRFLQLGAGFNIQYVNKYVNPRRISRLFDVLIHFDETHASVRR
ncbi:MAG TPA: erythromycin esterase family protein [Bacteroidetes bacterium]|nr:erythromycin esterase family protein [Bacteroidota bacterium]